MKLYVHIGIVLCGFILFCSYSPNVKEDVEWGKYELPMAIKVNLPSYLIQSCSESMCFFSSEDGKPFESLRVERYYLNPQGGEEFLKQFNYSEIHLDSTTVYVINNEEEGHEPSSSAYFQTKHYEYRLAYTGPNPKIFYKFLKSIEIDFDLLKKQFEENKSEPDFSKLDLHFDIDLKEKILYYIEKRIIAKFKCQNWTQLICSFSVMDVCYVT